MNKLDDAMLRTWMLIDAALTPEQRKTTEDVAQRWGKWLEDPDRNPPPNPRATERKTAHADAIDAFNAAAQMHQRASKAIARLTTEQLGDPEPHRQWFPAEHMAWAARKALRQSRMDHWAEYL